jgi:hypothetical protein
MILTLTQLSENDSEILAGIDAICESARREYDDLFSRLTENTVLNEFAIGELIDHIIQWLKEFVRKVVAFLRRAWDMLRGKYNSKIPAAEAQGVDRSMFHRAADGLGAAAVDRSEEPGMTCGQLLRKPGFVHPTDHRAFDVHVMCGATMAGAAVKDYEEAFVTLWKAETAFMSFGHPIVSFQKTVREIMNRTANKGGYDSDTLNEKGKEYWYLGQTAEQKITSAAYQSAVLKIAMITKDMDELQKGQPGEKIAGMFMELKSRLKSNRQRFSNPQSVVDKLRGAGNDVVQFHNALVRGTVAGYQDVSVFMMTCLRAVSDKGIDVEAREVNPDALRIAYSESKEYLHEGLGSFVKNLATGNMEKEIKELAAEAKDISTPEQQRLVITKIVRLLERLVQIRHSPSKFQAFVHDSAAWFQRATGSDDAAKEMSVRTGEAIRELAALRDKVLSKKWDNDEYNQNVDQLKAKVRDLLDKAATSEAEY